MTFFLGYAAALRAQDLPGAAPARAAGLGTGSGTTAGRGQRRARAGQTPKVVACVATADRSSAHRMIGAGQHHATFHRGERGIPRACGGRRRRQGGHGGEAALDRVGPGAEVVRGSRWRTGRSGSCSSSARAADQGSRRRTRSSDQPAVGPASANTRCSRRRCCRPRGLRLASRRCRDGSVEHLEQQVLGQGRNGRGCRRWRSRSRGCRSTWSRSLLPEQLSSAATTQALARLGRRRAAFMVAVAAVRRLTLTGSVTRGHRRPQLSDRSRGAPRWSTTP